ALSEHKTLSISWSHYLLFSVEKKLIELLEKQSGLHTSVDCSTPLTEQSLSRNDGEDQTRRNAENMFGDD
ncbi:hypothetical protein, partial [Escherichia coli]|uniref:hypothetical protein n=3 Tax=Escherichia coli TaxID=562 RepID=UPI003D969026